MKTSSLTENLKTLLADSYVLMLKTQNYHWNVTGMNFSALHAMFQTQYEDLFQAVDVLAERLRAVGAKAPGTFMQFQKLSDINSEETQTKDTDMISSLISDHTKLVKTATALVAEAQEQKDDATMDIAIERIQTHEKYIWMLKSTLS